jgi:integrase
MSAYVTSLRPIVDHLGGRRVQSVTKDDIETAVQALRTGTSKIGTWNVQVEEKREEGAVEMACDIDQSDAR